MTRAWARQIPCNLFNFVTKKKEKEMLKELYLEVVANTRAAMVPKLVDLPDGKVLLYTPGSAPEVLDKDRVLHADNVSSTESMLDWCACYGESDLVVKVFRSRIEVSAYRSTAHLTDTLKFDLTLTPAVADLLLWCERPRTQAQVVAALRTTLAETFDDKMLPIFRRLDFSRKNDGSKSISHTGESLGKSVEARAQTASGEIPEILAFATEVYSNISAPPVLLRFALDVDANQEIIKITPIGDSIIHAYQVSSRAIVADLKAKLPEALVVCCE